MIAKIVAGLVVMAGLGMSAGAVWATSGPRVATSCTAGCCPGPCCDDPSLCPNGCCPGACCGESK
jgi:hypothetical protein